jgi:indole-3-glycerol phosphate synthase
MTGALERILEGTRARVEGLRSRSAELEREASGALVPPDWAASLRASEVALVAEVKRRSPSAGDIAPGLDPRGWAEAYVRGGARAISVLTEAVHFGGSIDDIAAVRSAVEVPLLRKDFMLDPLQILEARAAGASAVLLIVRVLDAGRMRALSDAARELELARLVEVHDRAELDLALQLEPESVGVNARDLATFSVDPAGVESVLRAIPAGVVAVAESGIGTRADVERVAAWGADAVLVGTAVAGAQDREQAVRDLAGVKRVPGERAA